MISAGEYAVKGVLDISCSLVAQREKHAERGKIYKAVIATPDTEHAVYFVDPGDWGAGTVIEVLADRSPPVLFPEDYRVVAHASYACNLALVDALLRRKSE